VNDLLRILNINDGDGVPLFKVIAVKTLRSQRLSFFGGEIALMEEWPHYICRHLDLLPSAVFNTFDVSWFSRSGFAGVGTFLQGARGVSIELFCGIWVV